MGKKTKILYYKKLTESSWHNEGLRMLNMPAPHMARRDSKRLIKSMHTQLNQHWSIFEPEIVTLYSCSVFNSDIA
jgi:hypothetical protein